MSGAELERVSFRRYRRARTIRTETRAVTQPLVFVMPPPDELARLWADYLRSHP